MDIKSDLYVILHLLVAITLYPTQQSRKCFHIRNCQYAEFQISGVVGTLGEKLDSFSPLGFDIQRRYDRETQKIKLFSVRALQ